MGSWVSGDDTIATPQASPLVQWGFVSLAVAYGGRICKDCNGGIFVALTFVYMLWQGRRDKGEASGASKRMMIGRGCSLSLAFSLDADQARQQCSLA